MERSLLNPNQQRRVATHLRLLKEDLEDVAGWPELARPGEPYAALAAVIGRLRQAVEALRRSLALPEHRPPPLRRRVMAVAEVWASSIEDIRASNLRAYGEVHPELKGHLDPAADRIVRMLREMADVAGRLPDR